MAFENFFAVIGTITTLGSVAAAFAYILFQQFAKQWIETKFAERLEQVRHQQAMQVERLRVEIESMLSGAIKLQGMEFEALVETWKLLNSAYEEVGAVLSPLQQYPDLSRYSQKELEEFLTESKLRESQKDSIRNSSNKGKTYSDIRDFTRMHEAKSAYWKLAEHVRRIRISVSSDIYQEISPLPELLWSAIVDKEVGRDSSDWKMQNEGWKKIQKELVPSMDRLGETIRRKLESHREAESRLPAT